MLSQIIYGPFKTIADCLEPATPNIGNMDIPDNNPPNSRKLGHCLFSTHDTNLPIISE